MLFACLSTRAGHLIDSAYVTINLTKLASNDTAPDSVFLIFDKYDGSGAGIILRTCYTRDGSITVKVPSGRYHVELLSLNKNYRFVFDNAIYASARHNKTVYVSSRTGYGTTLPKSAAARYMHRMKYLAKN